MYVQKSFNKKQNLENDLKTNPSPEKQELLDTLNTIETNGGGPNNQHPYASYSKSALDPNLEINNNYTRPPRLPKELDKQITPLNDDSGESLVNHGNPKIVPKHFFKNKLQTKGGTPEDTERQKLLGRNSTND